MNRHHPFERWNDHLHRCCSAWADLVNTYSGISASVKTDYPLSVKLTVKRNEMALTSFMCQLQYKADGGCTPCLVIRSVKSFDYAGYVRALPEDDKMPFYLWEEDEIAGEEIFHEGFIAESITIAFSKYLEATGNTIH